MANCLITRGWFCGQCLPSLPAQPGCDETWGSEDKAMASILRKVKKRETTNHILDGCLLSLVFFNLIGSYTPGTITKFHPPANLPDCLLQARQSRTRQSSHHGRHAPQPGDVATQLFQGRSCHPAMPLGPALQSTSFSPHLGSNFQKCHDRNVHLTGIISAFEKLIQLIGHMVSTYDNSVAISIHQIRMRSFRCCLKKGHQTSKSFRVPAKSFKIHQNPSNIPWCINL